MRDPVVFIIWSEPVAKGRPRFSRRRTYTPKKTKQYEDRVAEIARREMQSKPPLGGAVRMEVIACFRVPPSWPRWKRLAAQAGLLGHTHRPDLDNLGKAISDALNGIVYEDDSQITEMDIKKSYGYRDCVQVKITPLKIHAAKNIAKEDLA